MIDAVKSAIMERVEGGRWPAGWVLLSGSPGVEEEMSRFCDVFRLGPTVYLFTRQNSPALCSVRYPDAAYVLSGPKVFSILCEHLLPSRLFNLYVIWLWDEVGPGNALTRASYLLEGMIRVRKVMGRATVVAVTFSPRGGGRGFQSEVALRLDLLRNHRGTVLTVGGPQSVLGSKPILIV